ncbi:MAG: hypothetical protein B7X34_06250, partial [Acidobacteriia bacterium 12-62-4]
MSRTLSFLLATCLAALPAAAQQSRASFFGLVTDSSGASIPGAKVTITAVDTNQSTVVETSGDGLFSAPLLTIGNYSIAVEKQGFKRAVRSGLNLQVDQRSEINFRLDVGGTTETIEVRGEAALVDTGSATVGKVVENRRVVELPLNGRNALALTLLTPSVKSNAGPTNSGFGDRGIQLSSISINGGPNAMNAQSLDGGNNIQSYIGEVAISPAVDAVEEFKVQSGTMSAEFGFTGGGVINMVTKSGTNDFHGLVFDLFRNEKLDARSFLAPTRSTIRQNEFGATFGGPVWIPKLYNGKNKSFFHFVYSGFRFRQGAPNTLQSLIPLDFRQGDFSRLASPIYDRSTGAPFPGNRIPTSRFSSVARNILPLIPQPINTGLFNNYLSVGRGASDSNQYNVKLDHAFSDRNRISGFFNRDYLLQADPETIAGPTTPGRTVGSQNTLARLSHDLILSPTILNHLNVGFTRFRVTIDSFSLNQNWPTQIGLRGINDGANNGFPCVEFVASGYTRLGDPNCNARVLQANNAFQVNESLSVVRGSHNLKFGFDYRFMETNGIDNFQAPGLFQFNALETGLPNVANSGNAI